MNRDDVNLREAAEMALETLDAYRSIGTYWLESDEKAFQALCAALAEAEEPATVDHKVKVTVGYDGSRKVDLKSLLESPQARAQLEAIGKIECATHPPRREPLTEKEVRRLYREAWTPKSEADEVLAFARAIERAHGIGGDE